MNREIKFRAWDGECFYTPILYNELIFKTDMDFENYYDSKDEVNQYTGLKDKNGKEIYEGDIIHYPSSWHEKIEKAEVIFKDGIFYGGYQLKDVAANCEVIGNIYENSDLLGVQHD